MIKLETIKELVEIETGIRDISSRERSKFYVDARVIFYVLGIEEGKSSFSKLGRFLNKNHATVLHSYKNIYDQWKTHPHQYKDNLRSLRTVQDMINKDLKSLETSIEEPKDDITKQLLYNYKRRNTLLKKEIETLVFKLDKMEKEVERLKKYEPIW